MSSLPPSCAALVVRSGFRLMRAVYLVELQWVALGVPSGAMTLAAGLQTSLQRSRLFDAVADPAFSRWQGLAAQQVLGEVDAGRQAVLAVADQARTQRRYRRAAQLCGWLLLTSRDVDPAMHGALQHLRALRRDVYGAGGPAPQTESST